jgi:hypothetical protein
MATDGKPSIKGRVMDAEWRRNISEALKNKARSGGAAIKSAANSVGNAASEAKASAMPKLKSGLEKAKAGGTLLAGKAAFGKGFNKTAMDTIGRDKVLASAKTVAKDKVKTMAANAGKKASAASLAITEAVKRKGKSSAINVTEASKRKSAATASVEKAAEAKKAAEAAAPIATAVNKAKTKIKSMFTRESSASAAEKMRARRNYTKA